MQDKDLKTKLIAFRLNKQLLSRLELARNMLETRFKRRLSNQKAFEVILAWFLKKSETLSHDCDCQLCEMIKSLDKDDIMP